MSKQSMSTNWNLADALARALGAPLALINRDPSMLECVCSTADTCIAKRANQIASARPSHEVGATSHALSVVARDEGGFVTGHKQAQLLALLRIEYRSTEPAANSLF